MTGARWRALAALALVLLLGAAALALAGRNPEPKEPATKPQPLLLLTSLPLMFGEQFTLEQEGSRALEALEAAYQVTPISTANQAELSKGKLLMMAHPPAQTPEHLVALDRWVRRGGRLLLLADPMLEWGSERPLGDPLRPAPMFSDTGLLAHWSLRLDAPDERGPKLRKLGGHEVLTASPGSLHGGCEISSDRLVADCRIGLGRAIVVADADLLNVENLEGPTRHNLDAVLNLLARLGRRDSRVVR